MTLMEALNILIDKGVIRADWFDDFTNYDEDDPTTHDVRRFQVRDVGCGCCSEPVELPIDLVYALAGIVGPDPWPAIAE